MVTLNTQYDVVVLGSGPAGLTSAIRCAQCGLKVAIIERDLLGGHAVNRGCIPLNAMMASARALRSIQESKRFGIEISSCRVNYRTIQKHRDDAVRMVRSQIRRFIDRYQVQVYYGEGKILDQNRLIVEPIKTENLQQTPFESETDQRLISPLEISFQNLVIATGVEYDLPIYVKQGDRTALDPTQLLWQQNIPKSLIIIGGGILGCEFASLYRYFQSRVILIEKNGRLLKFMDNEVSFAVEKRFKDMGIEVILNAQAEHVSDGQVILRLVNSNKTHRVLGDLIVVCTGGRPRIDHDYLKQIGIVINNDHCTSVPHIFACGGVASSCWSWVTCAVRQAQKTADKICNRVPIHEQSSSEYSHDQIPYVINVIPAVAGVGQIPKSDSNYLVYKFDFKYSKRAIVDMQTWGFIKLWTTVNQESKELLAVQLVHESAAELIEYYNMMIQLRIPLKDVSQLHFVHPTYAESVKEVCDYILGQSTIYHGTYVN